MGDLEATGTICPDCGGLEYRCPSGIVCTGTTCGGRGDTSGIPAPEYEPESRRSLRAASDAGDALDRTVGGRAEMSPAMERIVERVFAVDPAAAYERLEEELRLAGRASQADRATVADALDGSHDCAREAHRLYAYARVELEAFELDAKVVLSDMRDQATVALEQDRTARAKAKERAKQITEADVEAWIAAHYPAEWRDLQIRRKRAEKTVEHLERLAELWRARPRSLEALLASARL